MGVGTLEKILRKLDLRSLAEVDPSGKGPIDYAEQGTDGLSSSHTLCSLLLVLAFLLHVSKQGTADAT